MQHVRRPPRLAILLLRGLDHFAHDLIGGLPAATGWEVEPFHVANASDLQAALAWTDWPERDALWFEFCWPPFPRLINETDFGGRRVIVRVHRIEAYGTNCVAETRWRKVNELVVVSTDMARRVRAAAPHSAETTRLHVIHNGLDLDRFPPLVDWNPHRIGWCGVLSLHKNPVLALQILVQLRLHDDRYRLHVSGRGGDPVAADAFCHLVRRLDLQEAVVLDGTMSQAEIGAWHAQNGVLLSTSVYESFGYAICEAASVGCDLAVLDYVGAGEFWPDQVRFGAIDEAVWLIRNAAPHRWGNQMRERFSLERQLSAIREMLRVATAPGVKQDLTQECP